MGENDPFLKIRIKIYDHTREWRYMRIKTGTNEGAILIVEDKPMTKEHMEDVYGHKFIVQQTERDAMRTLVKTDVVINLIVLDDFVYNSIGALNKFRSISKTIPIFMMTSCPNLKREAIKCGVTGFIAEPFDIESFQDVFNRYCSCKELSGTMA